MANLKALDADGVLQHLKSSGAGTDLDPLTVQHSDPATQDLLQELVNLLPVGLSNGKLKVDLASSDLLLTAIQESLVTIAGYTNTLESLLTTLNSYADGLETLLGTANTTQNAISGFLDQLEGYTDSIETNQNIEIDIFEEVRDRLNAVDFGTQATLVAILAKLIATPATEAKQDALAVLNTSIRDRLPVAGAASEATLIEVRDRPSYAGSVIATPYSAVAITAVTALTNLGLVQIDLNTLGHRSEFAIEIAIATSGAAPGASRTFTLNYAFCTQTGATALELTAAKQFRVCNLVNTNSVTQYFTIEPFLSKGRYLNLFYDHSVRDASSILTLTTRLIAV